ncbi:MAG: hypothetical protein K0S00_426 [Xanthobacteraceae bacterium]|jgi:ppGpp synthetase/RelA/SpoT-type nucleotidyltranferase|nr:hypothetical protein [Xanthobacteraceae bacterium]
MKDSDRVIDELEIAYKERYDRSLVPLAHALESYIKGCLEGVERIDRICARAKSVKSFVDKAVKETEGIKKYIDPINDIQDQIGARIIVYYQNDVDRISNKVKEYINFIEEKKHTPDHSSKFGYFGLHYIFILPIDIIDINIPKSMIPPFFELQIKTLFQHAWSEAEHDLGYKFDEKPLTDNQYRRLAFTAAQAWGADMIFSELFRERSGIANDVSSASSGGGAELGGPGRST